MKKRRLAMCIAALALWAATGLAEAGASASPSVQPDAAASTAGAARELTALREGLAAKKEELAKLHHRWMVSKGRTPTAAELKEFEKKRAKGAVKPEDNPYVTKSALSTPGRWREAYYKKLEEIKRDEERAARLEQELQGVK
jgi:hypothetical protein